MKKHVSAPEGKQIKEVSQLEADDRRNENRRKVKGDGYTYVPIVGWYCRRNKTRRDDDDESLI